MLQHLVVQFQNQLPFFNVLPFFDVQFFHIAAHAISRRHIGNVFRTYRPLKVDVSFESLRGNFGNGNQLGLYGFGRVQLDDLRFQSGYSFRQVRLLVFQFGQFCSFGRQAVSGRGGIFIFVARMGQDKQGDNIQYSSHFMVGLNYFIVYNLPSDLFTAILAM